jgi:methionine synthase I (cobalamin-dependent)
LQQQIDIIMSNKFSDLRKEKVIVFDGAIGSNRQWQNLTIIEKVHTGFLDVGSDMIETNSFGGEIYHGNLLDEAKEHHWTR